MQSIVVQSELFLEVYRGLNSTQKKAVDRVIAALQENTITPGMRYRVAHSVPYMKFTDKGRLVLALRKINDQSVWVLLELLPNHELGHSTYFGNKAAVDIFCEASKAEITAKLSTAGDGEVIVLGESAVAGAGAGTESTVAESETSESVSVEVCHFQGKLLVPTKLQSEHIRDITTLVASSKSFAGLVAGVPGSGKTFMASELLNGLIATGGVRNIIYVTESAHLRAEIQKQWESSAACTDDNRSSVSFDSYESLMRNVGLLNTDLAVGDDDLKRFFTAEMRRQASLRKSGAVCSEVAERLSTVGFSQFRQECDVMASLNSSDRYKAAGSSHSLFHGQPELQDLLWGLYTQYSAVLTEAGCYHSQFTQLASDSSALDGALVIVDEALDLSRCQLQSLKSICRQVIFLGDDNQDLAHVSRTMAFLEQLIAQSSNHKYLGKLEQTFRCALNVIAVANVLLKMKKQLAPHSSDFVESALDLPGSIEMMSGESSMPKLRAFGTRVDTAVICTKGKQEVVASQLNSSLTFSVDQIKGLGYRRIILWGMVSPTQAQQFLALCDGPKSKRSELTTTQKVLLLEINQLFTAITRAEQEIIVAGPYLNHPAVQRFYKLLTAKVVRMVGPVEAVEEGPSSLAEWQVHAKSLLQQGRREQAEKIAADHHFELTPVHPVGQTDSVESKAFTGAGVKPNDKPQSKQKPNANKSREPEVFEVNSTLTFSLPSRKKNKKNKKS